MVSWNLFSESDNVTQKALAPNNVDVNGEENASQMMDVDPQEDKSSTKEPEKASQMSQQEVLQKMATARDFLGYTPLLRACEVYKNLKVKF